VRWAIHKPFGGAVKNGLDRQPFTAFEGTFPNCQYTPTIGHKHIFCRHVPSRISFDFSAPKLLSSGGQPEQVATVLMPKASVNEDHRVATGKDQIG
jgi:hypothetical protein